MIRWEQQEMDQGDNPLQVFKKKRGNSLVSRAPKCFNALVSMAPECCNSLCEPGRECQCSGNKDKGALASKNSEKCTETQKIKQTQSIKLNMMKSRANQSDLRIKETIRRRSNNEQNPRQDLGKETKIRFLP